MDSYLKKVHSLPRRFTAIIKLHKFKSIALALAIIIIGGSFVAGKPETETAQAVLKQVNVIAVSDLFSDGGTIPVVGTLQANEQLDLRPSLGGQVSVIHVDLGDQVNAGDILVELNHRDLDAQVAQASASLQSALATLQKMKSGDRAENIIITEQNLEQAKQQLLDMQNGGRPEEVAQAGISVNSAKQAVDDAYANHRQTVLSNQVNYETALQNAVLGIETAQFAADQILDQDLSTIFNESNDNQLYASLKDPALESQAFSWRRSAEHDLDKWRASTKALAVNDVSLVEIALDEAGEEIRNFIDFLDFTADAMQEAVSTGSYSEAQISSAISTLHLARSTMKGHLDAVVSYKQSLVNNDVTFQKALDAAQTQINNAENSLAQAQEQLQIIKQGATLEQISIQEAKVLQAEQQLLIAKNGARPEDIQLQNAAIAQARASLALASANREKALIRAPISGEITYLPVKLSDVVGSSTIIVSLANKSGLEVEAYVSENERAFLAVGNTVLINDEFEGVVNQISPALDPVNKKIKVLTAVTSEQTSFTLGESVRLELQKITPEQSTLLLPLSAVKLTGTGASVFVVTDKNSLEQVPVEIGAVSANRIELLTPFDESDLIVSDARGLKAGQEVTILE